MEDFYVKSGPSTEKVDNDEVKVFLNGVRFYVVRIYFGRFNRFLIQFFVSYRGFVL